VGFRKSASGCAVVFHRHVPDVSGEIWFDSWWPHQRDGIATPAKLLFLGIITPPQRQHVCNAIDHDRLPTSRIPGSPAQ
jgi:hypothetical protein